jgi:hypothetical protein
MTRSLYTLPRRLFWRRWQPKLSKLSQNLFFDFVWELSDRPSYTYLVTQSNLIFMPKHLWFMNLLWKNSECFSKGEFNSNSSFKENYKVIHNRFINALMVLGSIVDEFIVILKGRVTFKLSFWRTFKFIHCTLQDHKCFGIKINRLYDIVVYILT